MISIIICSRQQSIRKELQDNINDTMGCEHELIVIDNSQNNFTIFQAYNEGIRQSNHEIFCFIHDDIVFHSKGWGAKLLEIFSTETKIGLVGVAGAKVKTKLPSGWWNCPLEFKEVNIIQHLKSGVVEKWDYGFKNGPLSEVVAIDGVFIAMKKDCNFYFNELLVGFHNYDLNISFECIQKGFKIVVTNEILIEHYSNGEINNSWYESTDKVHSFYQNSLPLLTKDASDFDILQLEFRNGMAFLNPFIKTGKIIAPLRIWLQLLRMKPTKVFHLKFLKSIRFSFK